METKGRIMSGSFMWMWEVREKESRKVGRAVPPLTEDAAESGASPARKGEASVKEAVASVEDGEPSLSPVGDASGTGN